MERSGDQENSGIPQAEDSSLPNDVIVREAVIDPLAVDHDGDVGSLGTLSPLHELLVAEDWNEALKRVQSHPQEIVHQSASGSKRTALHLACEDRGAPFRLIQTMIELEPLVVSMLDEDGCTPLHSACSSEHAYDPAVIATLIACYPQALLMQDRSEKATPLHMLLVLGGSVNMTCLTMVLDVAYSRMAGLPDAYVPALEFSSSELATSVPIAATYPPVLIQAIRDIAINDPYAFPSFLRPFLHIPCPVAIEEVPLEQFENQTPILLMQDSKQQTPLHSATVSAMPGPVVRKLLNERRYPGAHEAAFVKGRKNRYPIFYAGVHGMPLESIRLIFDVNKEGVYDYCQYKINSVQVSYICLDHNIEDRKLELKSSRTSPNESIEQFFCRPSGYTLFAKVMFYTRVAYYQSYDDDMSGKAYRAVHASAGCSAPPQFVRAVVRLYPWQARERDEEGNLPIHIACKQYYPLGHDPDHYWLAEGYARDIMHRILPEDRERDVPIAILVDAYPGCASYLDQDHFLPLHLAIINGRKWIEGVKQLVSAAPLSLTSRDIKYGLYPFMLAAMEETSDLDVVFNLLRENPMMVRSACDRERSTRKNSDVNPKRARIDL